MPLTSGESLWATGAAQCESKTAAAARTALGLGTLATQNEVAANHVTNARLADMTAGTFKARQASAGDGDPSDLTATQATAELNNMVGDSGAGGTKGLVPAPSAGDAAAGKFLGAAGTWSAPSGTLTHPQAMARISYGA